MRRKSIYYVYIVECVNKAYYIGYVIDLEERIEKHNTDGQIVILGSYICSRSGIAGIQCW